MRARNLYSFLALATLGTGGCASPPQVTPIHGELYRVAARGSPFDSQAGTNVRALAVANAYCASQGKELLFRQAQESGAQRFSPKREEMTFTCMSAADPAYLRAGLSRNSGHAHDSIVAQQ